jgi:glycosyltransferase involved in cell wall biosynthesis
MNVVMIGPFGLQPKGTVSARALPMAKALVARGHGVTLLIPPWDHPADAGREWEEDGVRVVNLPLPLRLPLFFHLALALRLVRLALALRPDVVHCFKPKAYSGLAHFILWWLCRLGLAHLRLVVDEDDWEQAWNDLAPYSRAQRRVFVWQERWGLTHADAVVVASRELMRLVAGMGVPPGRIFYVPNGIRPLPGDAPHPQAARMLWELDDALVILLYTRFFEFTLERVVEVLRRVVAQEPRAKLLIVGEGLFSEEADLDDLLANARLSEHAVFTSWVEFEHLPDYFAAADVAIFPYDDTLVNRTKCSAKLVDLLTAGLPVVANAVGQNAEYIADGESGLLVPPADDAAFADAVLRLLADAGLRSRLGAAAARRMHDCFDWQHLAAEVEKAY